MALDSRSKVRLGWFAAAAAPMIAVQVAQVLFGGGPAAATAEPSLTEEPTGNAAAPGEAPAMLIGPPETAALAWLAERAGSAQPLTSPMHRAPAPVVPVQVFGAAKGEDEKPLPDLRLGGVISRGRGAPVASINNRLFVSGDQPADGWTIETIDHDNRRVMLVRVDGRRIELTSDGVVDPTLPK